MDKVVSFSRDGEYLLKRADVNRGEGRFLEALKLCRRAVELEPGNAAAWMDEAQTLCEMGRHAQSNRVLALMLSVPGAPSDCYLGMGCNFLGQGDAQAAFGAIMNLISLDTASLKRPDVVMILRQIIRLNSEQSYDVRENRRVDALSRSAEALLEEGRAPRAEALAERAYRMSPDNIDTARVYARTLAAAGDAQKANEVIDKALSGPDVNIKAELEAVRINVLRGNADRAREMEAELIARPHIDWDQLSACLDAACAVLDDENVATLAAKALRFAPFDTRIFHICAANRVRMGKPIEQAVSFWTRANSIDPDDAVIRYYLRSAVAGNIDSGMTYDFALPASEQARLDGVLKRALTLSGGELDARFAEAGDLRDACVWATRSERSRSDLAGALLSRSKDAWALRELAESRVETYRQNFARVKCRPASTVTRVGAGCVSASPTLERAVKLASAAAFETLGGENIAQVYRALKPLAGLKTFPRCGSTRAWAAVLAYVALDNMGIEADLGDLAERLSCPLRRVMTCLREYESRGGDK